MHREHTIPALIGALIGNTILGFLYGTGAIIAAHVWGVI